MIYTVIKFVYDKFEAIFENEENEENEEDELESYFYKIV